MHFQCIFTGLFQHQSEFTNAEFYDKTEKDLISLLAAHAAKFGEEVKTVGTAVALMNFVVCHVAP
jgi:hypothetical protein